jgi:hypothetical protein
VNYYFDKTPEDAVRETPIETFDVCRHLATEAVAAVVLGVPLAYATVCPGWADDQWDRYDEYQPIKYTTRICYNDESGEGDTEVALTERIVRDIVLTIVHYYDYRMPGVWMVDGMYEHIQYAAGDYEKAGGFGPRPDAEWLEHGDPDDWDVVEDILMEWRHEQTEMLAKRVVKKAKEVVRLHREAILRVAVALCYHGTLSGEQVIEIVRQTQKDTGSVV